MRLKGTSEDTAAILSSSFRFFDALTPAGRERLLASAERRSVAPKTMLIQEEEHCEALFLVGSGHLRVFKSSASGREITLYRVRRGDACVLGMSSVLSGSPYPANVVVPTAAEVVAIDAGTFRALYAEESAVQALVVRDVSRLIAEMMTLVAEVAFRRVDQRLAAFLLEDVNRAAGGVVAASHEEIATHLGTAREVVSRLLENFRDDGLIESERRRIVVLDRPALENVRDAT